MDDKEKIDQMSATIYKNYKMRSEKENRLTDFQAELNCFLIESLHFLRLPDKYDYESDHASFQALFFSVYRMLPIILRSNWGQSK